MNRFLFACLFFSASAALAAPTTSGRLSGPAIDMKGRIERALKENGSLSAFYSELGRDLGNRAIEPLIELANDERTSEELRRTSLFGLGRIAGKQSLGVIQKFMGHQSWMLRDAALRTAAALDAKELRPQIERRLSDDALVVRTTAVQTIGHLGLTSCAPKLVEALFDPMNYVGTKALWIHKHILQVIADFHYRDAVPRLVTLLERSHDEQLQGYVISTLERLTGRSFPNKPLQQQVYLWKRNTLSEVTF